MVLMALVMLGAGETKPDPANESKQAVSVVRLLSAAEVGYFHTHRQYASLAELIESKQLSQTALQFAEHLPAFTA